MKIRTLLLSLAALAVSVSAYAETMFYATVYNEYGEGAPSGVVKIDEAGVATYWNTTIGGVAIEFSQPEGIALDGSGNVYVNDSPYIYKIAPDGTASVFATMPSAYSTGALSIDSFGNVYASGSLANTPTNVVYVYNPAGAVQSTWITYAAGMAFSPDNVLYGTDYGSVNIYNSSGVATEFSQIDFSQGIGFSASGELYVAGFEIIYKVNDQGLAVPIYEACDCTLFRGLTVDSSGNIYIAAQIEGEDFINHNYVLLTTPDGTTTTFSTLGDDQRVNSIAQAIPEPSAILLLGLGLVVMLFVWPRVRRS